MIDQAIEAIIQSHFPDSRLCRAMRYSLMASGKRLRPILCLAAAETVGTVNPQVIAAACGIEMIHTYSLIHDDLPAMDNDDLRRGNPTCHVRFDEATAILAGDALLTFAFEILASSEIPPENAGRMLAVIRNISLAAGHKGMIEGQMRDIAAEGKQIDINALQALHGLKTGALISASVAAGALLGGGSSRDMLQLETYARHIGLAFQVVDDVLNVDGDEGRMGKATGTDASRGKSTYPSLLGLDRSRALAAELVDRALGVIDGFGDKANALAALAGYVIDRKR